MNTTDERHKTYTDTLIEVMLGELELMPNDKLLHYGLADLYADRAGPGDDVRSAVHRLASEGKAHFHHDHRKSYRNSSQAIDTFVEPSTALSRDFEPDTLTKWSVDYLTGSEDILDENRVYGEAIRPFIGWYFMSHRNVKESLHFLYENIRA